MLVPVAFKNYNADKKETILAGDIGGTKVNIALYQTGEKGLTILRQQSFHSKDYSSLTAVIQQFTGNDALPEKICMAVAGPVIDGKVKITNLPWQLDSNAMRKELQVKNISFINDLEATAFGLAGLKPEQLSKLDEGNAEQHGNIAIIAPGTGLGEAGLYWDGKFYHPFATEGGHSAFASRTPLDFELYNWLAKQFNYICWEHVICGPGIHNIFRFLTEEKKNKIPEWLLKEMETEDPSAVISENAIAGKDEVCIQAMELFIRYLATESSSLVLKYKATGGLFLGGGIPPKILPLLKKDNWQQLFFESDRMETLLQQTPVNVILNEKTPLLGAVYYGAYNM
jgi:glucokinase